MTPSFEQEAEAFRENPDLEQEYISGLRDDCCSQLDKLYASCGRENKKRPLIGVLKTQKELGEISYPWIYETGFGYRGMFVIPEGISYIPIAMSLSSDRKVYIGIEIVPEVAEQYLRGLYNHLLSEDSETVIVERPEGWNADCGPYQLRNRSLKVLPKFLRGVVVKPSLIIACDVTKSNFGQAYLKRK
ncbi:MAG: hypothetical protein WCY37_01920 [Candidatus Dojkabacteria bacterium]